MKVSIPSPLVSYTKERDVEASGSTLGEVLADLDVKYPGLRFRMIDEQGKIRPHIRVFLNGSQVFDTNISVSSNDEIHIVQALSGG